MSQQITRTEVKELHVKQGPRIKGYTIGKWDEPGKPSCVALVMHTEIGDLVHCIQSPADVDSFVESLRLYKSKTWPEAV